MSMVIFVNDGKVTVDLRFSRFFLQRFLLYINILVIIAAICMKYIINVILLHLIFVLLL